MSVLFIHYEVEPEELQPHLPFVLDVRDGKAYVSVVAFSQERLRFAFGGELTNWVGRWFANHEFLNVRTYVRHCGEPGIYFLAEWVPKREATWLGPPLFGLPYRLGTIRYDHQGRRLHGVVTGRTGRFAYEASPTGDVGKSEPGSLDEWLLERYVAYTEWRGLRRQFRVTHEPWPQTRASVTVEDESLLRTQFAWWPDVRLAFANYSTGVESVCIGWPEFERKGEYESIGHREQWAYRV